MGLFLCSALAGAAYGHVDSTSYAWCDRFRVVLVPVDPLPIRYFEYFGLRVFIEEGGWPYYLKVCWMAHERMCAVDWERAAVERSWSTGPYFRYDPLSGDIEDISSRLCGKFFDSLRGSCRVAFLNHERFNELPPASWFRHETFGSYGELAYEWLIIFGFHSFRCALHEINTGDRKVREAEDHHDRPFGEMEKCYYEREPGLGCVRPLLPRFSLLRPKLPTTPMG